MISWTTNDMEYFNNKAHFRHKIFHELNPLKTVDNRAVFFDVSGKSWMSEISLTSMFLTRIKNRNTLHSGLMICPFPFTFGSTDNLSDTISWLVLLS